MCQIHIDSATYSCFFRKNRLNSPGLLFSFSFALTKLHFLVLRFIRWPGGDLQLGIAGQGHYHRAEGTTPAIKSTANGVARVVLGAQGGFDVGVFGVWKRGDVPLH